MRDVAQDAVHGEAEGDADRADRDRGGAFVVLIIRGLWRATAVQEGTGCPCCDKAMGADHEPTHAGGQQSGNDQRGGGKA